MKKFVSILLFFCLCFLVFAQNPAEEIISRMNYIFQHVDRSKVTTGLLSDYGIQPIPIDYYNGVPADSNFVDADSYKLLYAGLFSSKFNENISLITPDELSARINNYASGGAIPVSVMHYTYNRFKETALSAGLVSVANDQIFDVPGKNPYETADLFAAAPKEVVTEGGDVSFIFPTTLRMSNVNKSVQSLQVRFDENLAYQNIGWNIAINHIYTTEGIKKVRFKINYTDGTSCISQTNIVVCNIPQPPSPFRAAGPGDAGGIAGARYDVPISGNGQHSGGVMQFKLASSNTTGKIQKALIIAEGFDVAPLLDMPNMNLDVILEKPKNYGYITDDIDINNYDIVYVDNAKGMDDIRRNAALFMQAMEMINSPAYRNADAAPNVVMGISMGGLVARYALRKMELQRKDHKTWKYISMDSPHKGANVPVGIQGALRHLSSFDIKFLWFTLYKMTDIPQLGSALEILNSPAAKQMLIYNVNDSGTGYDNSVHNTFLAKYEQLGFPQKCQNVAVSNGNLNGNQLFSPGSQLFDIRYKVSPDAYYEYMNIFHNLHPLSLLLLSITYLSTNPKLFLNVIPGRTSFGVYADIHAISTSANAVVYSGALKLHKKILWLIPSSATLTSSTLRTEAGMAPIDGMAGGVIDLENYLDDAPAEFQKFVKQPKFCFIPRGSALALDDWNTNYTANLQGQDLFAVNKTSFEHAAMSHTIPESHITFDKTKPFIVNQLIDKPIYPQAFQSSFCGAQNITIGNPQFIPITWSVSDNAFNVSSATNTSATLTSAPDVRNAILTIHSSNSFPLKRGVFGTCNLSISGPSIICDQATYTIENLPGEATVEWDTYDPLDIFSGQGTSEAIIINYDSTGFSGLPSSVFATISLGRQSLHLTKEVHAGIPEFEYMNFEEPDVYEQSLADTRFHGATDYSWMRKEGRYELILVENDHSKAFIRPFNSDRIWITIVASNECGTWEEDIRFTPGSHFWSLSLSPNPAGSFVTLQLDKAPDNAKTAPRAMTNFADSGVYEIQLWNATGLIKTVKTNEPTVQIPLDGLPKGFYYVHVIKNGKTYRRQLVIDS